MQLGPHLPLIPPIIIPHSLKDEFVEVRGDALGFASVALVGSPVHSERRHPTEERVAEGGKWKFSVPAAKHIDGERAVWVVVVGCFVHFEALVPDLLAGPGEGAACWDVFELEGAILFLEGEDEGVDFVSGFRGEFEQWAAVLRVFFPRWNHCGGY